MTRKLLAVSALALTTLACADDPLRPSPKLDGPITLLAPEPEHRFVQNDESTGCPAHAARGYGFRLSFDWEDVEGAERYDIRLQRTGAQYPAVDYHVTESQFELAWCNAFVIDANLDDWVWSVAAIAPGESADDPQTLWSEERVYGFLPCRRPDGTPCFAPVE